MNRYTTSNLHDEISHSGYGVDGLKYIRLFIDRVVELALCNCIGRRKVIIETSHQAAENNSHQGHRLKTKSAIIVKLYL